MLEEGLKLFHSSIPILTKAHNISRALADSNSALALSSQLMKKNPDYFDGYARFAQDLNALKRYNEAHQILDRALVKFPDEKWILFTALQTYHQSGKPELAIDFGDALADKHFEFTLFHRSYFDILLICGKHQKASDFILRIPDSPARSEMHLDLLLNKRLYGDYFSEINRYLCLYPQKATDYAKRLRNFSIFRERGSELGARVESDVDVICIASDEAPYVADFIHHYIYLGFNNIFIGVNNCSDGTEDVIRKISDHFPKVHLLDVNNVIANFQQPGCYAHLFNYARNNSRSKYCMFVDVDEFWVADPFPRSIQDFIKSYSDFDCVAFQWLNIFNEGFLSPPLSMSNLITINPHVKSLVNYESEYVRFGAHSPTIARIDDPKSYLGLDRAKNFTKTPHGYLVHPITPVDIMPRLHHSGLGWIFHRLTRSEIEFCYRIFKVHANDDTSKVSFKSNRHSGFLGKKHNSEIEMDFLDKVFDQESISTYHSSLDNFKNECGIKEIISLESSKISESSIFSMLERIPRDIFERDYEILCKSFAGTRFDDYIKRKRTHP